MLASGTPTDPRAGPEKPAATVTRLKVLIVEDEFFIALDVQSLVEQLGHTVVGTAVSFDEAVQMAERERPNVALMDVRLASSRDGVDAAIEIKNRFGIDSIFVTANTDANTRQRAVSARPLAFLEKPLTISSLHAALQGVAPTT